MTDAKFSGILKEIMELHPNIDLPDFLADKLQLPLDKAEELAKRIDEEYCKKTQYEKSSVIRRLLEKPLNVESSAKAAVYAVDRLSEGEFEAFARWLFEELGYEIHPDKHVAKGGVDFIATKGEEKVLLYARRYPEGCRVSESIILLSQHAQHQYGCSRCIVVATAYFSEQAVAESQRLGVELWDRDALDRNIAGVREKGELEVQSLLPRFEGSLMQSLLRIGESKDFMIESRAGEKYDLYLTGVKFPLLTFQVCSGAVTRCVCRIKYFEPVSESEGEVLIGNDVRDGRSLADDMVAYGSIVKYLEEFLD